MYAGDASRQQTADAGQPVAVTGESWLNHLHRSFGDTSMGKTGKLGPLASEESAARIPLSDATIVMSPVVTLRGVDLYRLNCRACHGDAGLGAPPEINSVIDPVRATSTMLIIERMKSRGMEMTPSSAAELAKQAKLALLQRLHNGGENMPPFPHLSEAEIRVLLAYLNQLAGVTPSGGQPDAVKESSLRVGEHIVKSTCHICHDATGPNPTYQQLEDGAIPPLDTLPARVSEVAFVRKVTMGAPIVMGTPPTPHRGRMPVFDYLTREEAADVYLYLTQVPPTQDATSPTMALSQEVPEDPGAPPRSPAGAPMMTTGRRGNVASDSGSADLKFMVLLSAIGVFVLALIAAGFAFTVREFRRLSVMGDTVGMARTATKDPRRGVAGLMAR